LLGFSDTIATFVTEVLLVGKSVSEEYRGVHYTIYTSFWHVAHGRTRIGSVQLLHAHSTWELSGSRSGVALFSTIWSLSASHENPSFAHNVQFSFLVLWTAFPLQNPVAMGGHESLIWTKW